MLLEQYWEMLLNKMGFYKDNFSEKQEKPLQVSMLLLFSGSVVSTLCDPMGCSMPGFLSFTVYWSFCSNSCPLSQQFYLKISSSVIPLSTCLQYFPAQGSFPMSQLFPSGGQSSPYTRLILLLLLAHL